MAEVAAGLWAAEEVVSTTAQVGVGAYYVGKEVSEPLSKEYFEAFGRQVELYSAKMLLFWHKTR